MKQQTFKIKDLSDTQNLAKHIANSIVADFVITLNGELGVGKTTFVREIIKNFGVTDNIKSPTFTYVEPYITDKYNIYHFDLYRFIDSSDWLNHGFDEYFNSSSLCFIEWAEKAKNYIPTIDWEINLILDDRLNLRIFEIIAFTREGEECLSQLMKHVGNSLK